MRPELVKQARRLEDAIVEYVRQHPDAIITDVWKATCPTYTYLGCSRAVKRLIDGKRLTVSHVVSRIRFLRVPEVTE